MWFGESLVYSFVIHTLVFGSYVAVVLTALVLLPWLSSVSEKHPSICCVEKNTYIYIIHTYMYSTFIYTCTYMHTHAHTSVLMIRVENCLDICFPIVNLLTFPLIMYSKFVWSNAKVGRKMSDDWLLS